MNREAEAAHPVSSSGHNPDEATDRALLARVERGDSEAATELYYRYAARLRSLARRKIAGNLGPDVEADDIVQSVFRSFFVKARRGLYAVPGGQDLWNLLLVITLNKIRDAGDFHRAARRDVRRRAAGDHLDRLIAARTRPDDEDGLSLRLVVQEQLAALPPACRQMIELRIGGYEVAEIAARTARSKRTVERTLQEFRRTLLAAIGEA